MSRPRAAALVVVLAGAGCLAAGTWIPAKAALAQALLRHAWSRTAADGAPVRPWPWAETWPVARLELPRLGVDAIVLAGAEGAALAFAPGHLDGTPLPGEPGNSALAGHRDTVFAFLGDLALGEEIVVETPDRRRVRYRVVDTRVVDERDVEVLAPTDQVALTLVTCYPIDAVRPGGPLRYVVRAVAVTGEAGLPGRPGDRQAGEEAADHEVGDRDQGVRGGEAEPVPGRQVAE